MASCAFQHQSLVSLSILFFLLSQMAIKCNYVEKILIEKCVFANLSLNGPTLCFKYSFSNSFIFQTHHKIAVHTILYSVTNPRVAVRKKCSVLLFSHIHFWSTFLIGGSKMTAFIAYRNWLVGWRDKMIELWNHNFPCRFFVSP